MSTWVFVHGSLMADPPFSWSERHVATAIGWRRTFGHPSVRNWGRPTHPAPTSALVPGDGVTGIGYLVGDVVIDRIVAREASEPIQVSISAGGDRMTAATWTMDSTWAHLGPEQLAEAALENVDAGGGPFGDAGDYLELVRSALMAVEVSDRVVEGYRHSLTELWAAR